MPRKVEERDRTWIFDDITRVPGTYSISEPVIEVVPHCLSYLSK